MPLGTAKTTTQNSVEGSARLNDTSQLKTPVARGENASFETEQGTLYVSKPYRSKTTKKLRAMVAFTPRTSHFDLSNAASGQDEFRVSPVYLSTHHPMS